MKEATFMTASGLAALGPENLPDYLKSGSHLIYSSPATLAFNSPGAEGFGVKRAGLAIPGSVMLLVSPGCCGRNTSLISGMAEYRGRFFYLTMDETDIVTGRHLKKIPEAVAEIVSEIQRRGRPRPSVVMICITCVDALLGTDMERVCRKAEAAAGLPVRPCYMYALTREGRKPPMVHVRQSLYSLLSPMKKKGSSVNILGYFAPLYSDCELYDYLRSAGVKAIREISTCPSFEEFLKMAEANFNLVLNPEARFAAEDMREKLKIPSIELRRLYRPAQIKKQYAALGRVLGVSFDDEKDYRAAEERIAAFYEKFGPLTFAVGECLNADPFELSLLLVKKGFAVSEIYGTVTEENFVFLRALGEASPDTRVYSNLEPTMLHYDSSCAGADLTLGRDAAYYHPDCPSLPWNSDRQPFGYRGTIALFDAMDALLSGEKKKMEGEKAQ